MRIQRSEAGMVGGMEAVVLGTLILIVGSLVIVNAWLVVDSKLAVSAAAREAVRAYVESPDAATAESAARTAAQKALVGYGRRAELATISFPDTTFARCANATAEVTYEVPLIALPGLGRLSRTIRTVGTHSEIVDPYRSGLPVNSNGGDPCA